MRAALFIALWTLAPMAAAQTPTDRWRTVDTEHYRVHYPAQAEAWALEAASQLDTVRQRVVEEVGYAPPQVVDVVVVDPLSTANGMAMPTLGTPRMMLFATPPFADSVIGHYRSWGELLTVHEDAHLVHMLRPSRNPLVERVDRIIGLGPITRKSPRWVTEGYATVIEARLTGFGRPHSDFRAQFLRELAREGRLPAYDSLDDTDRWMGGAFAYLVGSAFLEWLEARGPGTLGDLWARLSARQPRTFEDAFSGTFGESPSTLYARFAAELGHAALELERQRPAEPDTLWKEVGGNAGAPVLSPDGGRIAWVVHPNDEPARLMVWSTEIDEEAQAAREEAEAQRLERDPEDVRPAPPRTQPRKLLHSRAFPTQLISGVQWTADGEGLLYSLYSYDSDGRLRPDLYRLDLESGREDRLTVGADLRQAHPSADGRFAVAVQQDWGLTRLVRVDLSSGALESLTEAHVGVVYDRPRLSPDGERLAWLEHRGQGWDVHIRELSDDAVTILRRGGPSGPSFLQLAWGPDGERLYGSVGVDGFIEVHTLLDPRHPTGPVTRTHGGAFHPAPAPDGSGLYYLSFGAHGYDVHFTEQVSARPEPAIDASPLVGLPPLPEASEPPERRALQPRPYGLGRTEWRPLLGGGGSPSQGAVELGMRAGDIVGRRDAALLVSLGGGQGVTGAAAALAWRGRPIALRAQGFVASEGAEPMQRAGAEVSLRRKVQGHDAALSIEAGGWADAPLFDTLRSEGLFGVGSADGDRATPSRAAGFGALRLVWREGRGGWLGGRLEGQAQLGQTGGEGWGRADAMASVWVGRKLRLSLDYARGMSDTVHDLDRYRLGGIPSAILPEAWQQAQIRSPGFAVGSLRGSHRELARIELRTPVSFFAERHRMADGALPAHGATLVGLGGTFDFDPVPFAKIPGGSVGSGLGCLIETPDAGWSEDPCTSLQDYALWATVTWRL